MNDPAPVITYVIIAVTVLVSWLGFSDPSFVRQFWFDPRSILRDKQGYRLITSGFLHADWRHLAFNMYSLYLFGSRIELVAGASTFLFLYLVSIIGGSLLSLFIHRHEEYFALGASGGACGIMFAYILFFPENRLGLLFVPIMIPAPIFAVLFILYSIFGMRTRLGNIGHDAHLGGAIVGLLAAGWLHPECVRDSPRMFFGVLILAVGLLVYLVKNPNYR